MENLIQLTEISPVSTAKDGRNYYTAKAVNVVGGVVSPFSKVGSRTIFQQFTQKSDPALDRNDTEPRWIFGDPNQVKAFVGFGKPFLPGKVTTETVEAYDINGNQATSYTTIVFDGEIKTTVFKNMGHPLAVDAVATVVATSVLQPSPAFATNGPALVAP